MPDRPTIHFLDGDPGTGKSTWAEDFVRRHPSTKIVTSYEQLANAVDHAALVRKGEPIPRHIIVDIDFGPRFEVKVHKFEVRPTGCAYFVDGAKVGER